MLTFPPIHCNQEMLLHNSFCPYQDVASLDNVSMVADSGNSVELPSEFESGHLACYTPPGAIRPSRFVWLAGPGLYRGALSLASASESASELEVLAERSLLPLPLTSSMQENPLAVVSILQVLG